MSAAAAFELKHAVNITCVSFLTCCCCCHCIIIIIIFIYLFIYLFIYFIFSTLGSKDPEG